MKSFKRHCGRTLWLGLILCLGPVYLAQLIPHAHADIQHLPAHETPASHGHHSHSHDSPEADPPDGPQHHHYLTSHLDSHAHRVPNRDTSQDYEFYTETPLDGIEPFERPGLYDGLDHEISPPGSVPIVVGGPRAPPRAS